MFTRSQNPMNTTERKKTYHMGGARVVVEFDRCGNGASTKVFASGDQFDYDPDTHKERDTSKPVLALRGEWEREMVLLALVDALGYTLVPLAGRVQVPIGQWFDGSEP